MSSVEVKSGFFDSRDGDRVYGAKDFNSIFDGIINDGVLMSYGDQFAVIKNSSWAVTIKTGKAWFNNTWIINEINQNLELNSTQSIVGAQKRKDVIAIKVDRSSGGRETTIVNIDGTLSMNDDPLAPSMPNEADIYYHPIAYAIVNIDGIQKIQNLVNTDDCPIVTSIIQTTSLDDLLSSWSTDLDLFILDKQNEFDSWFAELQDILTDDQAANFAAEILALKAKINPLNGVKTVTLSEENWTGSDSPFYQNIAVTGIIESDYPVIDLIADSDYELAMEQEEAWSNIYKAVCSTNSILFYAYEKPTVSIPIKITLMRY